MRSIPVIFNPSANSAKAADRIAAIRELSTDLELCPTAAPGDARRLARELADAGVPKIVASGGDGTINEVVNGIMASDVDSLPALGLLPAGTMNVFALELGLPKDLVECWQVIEDGHVTEIDVWQAAGHCFVQLAGLGLDAEIIKETSWERKKALGPLSYVLSAARLIGMEAPTMLIEAAGHPVVEGSVVLLGNGKHYGAPLKVFPRANHADGLLDVIVVKKNGYGPLLSGLASLLFTEGRRPPADMEYFQTASLRITCAKEVPLETDGELVATLTSVQIERAGRRLPILVRR